MEGKRGSECLLKSVSNIDFNPNSVRINFTIYQYIEHVHDSATTYCAYWSLLFPEARLEFIGSILIGAGINKQ